ncbi:hypothetical protein JZ751_018818 [Albula glossodonta]|uniref:Uncharacterized protein n=1 Tax=Albula glossodonta TaxID=121402 RepID=A0A8T2NVY2_9TELE|nr:hypothetical protein JZ751_018818 [Albula glossodonta]
MCKRGRSTHQDKGSRREWGETTPHPVPRGSPLVFSTFPTPPSHPRSVTDKGGVPEWHRPTLGKIAKEKASSSMRERERKKTRERERRWRRVGERPPHLSPRALWISHF